MLKLARYFLDIDQRGARSIDYRTDLPVQLYQDKTYSKGELQQIDFYAESSINPDGSGRVLFSDLVVSEAYSYLKANGLVLTETITVSYYNESDAPDYILTLVRQHSASSRYGDSRVTRIANLDKIQEAVVGYLISTEPTEEANALVLVASLVNTLVTEVTQYVYTGSAALAAAIAVDGTGWLSNDVGGGVTIQDFILAELS
jgi:hypothetical protein